jgi:membrane dipeptidase
MFEEKQALLEGDEELPPYQDSGDSTRFPTRRTLVTRAWSLLIACSLTLIAFTLWHTPQIRHCHGHEQPRSIEERVNKILTETPLIGRCQFTLAIRRRDADIGAKLDGHNDLAILIRFLYGNRIYGSNFTELFVHGTLPGHVDLPRLKAGKVGGSFWSVYVGCPTDGANFSDANYAESRCRAKLWNFY